MGKPQPQMIADVHEDTTGPEGLVSAVGPILSVAVSPKVRTIYHVTGVLNFTSEPVNIGDTAPTQAQANVGISLDGALVAGSKVACVSQSSSDFKSVAFSRLVTVEPGDHQIALYAFEVYGRKIFTVTNSMAPTPSSLVVVKVAEA
jgi:hypothetical protein